nr:calcium/proton exchanger [Tanacetum cinerariifolium]
MSYDNLRELVRKLVSLYYCKVGKKIKQGLWRLENDADVQYFLKTGYESKWVVDLYVEHHGYNPMDYKNSNDRDYESPDSSDAYCSSDDEQVIDYVDFYHEGEQDVVVKNITTNDPFLTKLCSNNRNFRGFNNEPIPVNEDLHIEDPDSSSLEPTHQIQRGIAYPRYDPLQPWNKIQPILDMRYNHPEQLKLALANYEVAGGYQLWFQKNDWRQLLVYCGRDVST